jgi:hypothetical protein
MPSIFLRHGDNFIPMREQAYEAEDVLQVLIAEHPELLAGDEKGEAGAWVLIKREAGVADSDEGGDRWSLDHLFLDRAGVPTLVEVKRSSDTRARREVVAQMLDYAANATAYWSVESLRTWFEAACELEQVDPETRLVEAFEIADVDVYWETVKTNLAADRIRLVFVADTIPRELRSIIEFLNRQMTETEVFAIEVKQYADAQGEQQTIVPQILGRTEAAKAAKRGGQRRTRDWDEASLLAEVDRLHGADVMAIARSVIEWAKAQVGVQVSYGHGALLGSARIKLEHGNVALTAAFVSTDGKIAIPFDYMRAQAPFGDSEEARDELRRRINAAVPAADVPPDRWTPTFELNVLAANEARDGFFAALEWAFAEARRAQTNDDSAS